MQLPAMCAVHAGTRAEGGACGATGCARAHLRTHAPALPPMQARDGAGSSYTAHVAPWGEIAFESSTPFPADNQLSLWARGSGIMAVAIMCEDTANRRYSK